MIQVDGQSPPLAMATGYGGRPGTASSSSLHPTLTSNPALLPTSTLTHRNTPLLSTYASLNLVIHASRCPTFSHSNPRWQTRSTCTRISRKIVSQQFHTEFHWFGNALSATISAQAGFPSTKSSGLELRCLAMADPNTKPVQELIVMNKRGLKLKGLLVESSPNSKEVCVLCHGFRSSKQSGTLGRLSEALVEAGVSTFRFDFAGNGESEGEFAYGNYWHEVEDLRAVVEFLTSRGLRVVCVAGHSKGGNCVVLYASRYHDVPCVINISGRFALEKGIMDRLGGPEALQKLEEEGVLDIKDASGNVQYQVKKKDLRDRLTTNMHAACLAIPEPTRVLTIHGINDEVVPADDAYQFAQRIQKHKLSLIKDADHGYSSHQSELAKHVLDFLQETLQS